MRLVVTGGTGFIGSVLCARLVEQGHALTLLARSAPAEADAPSRKWVIWDGAWKKMLDGADGVIHLAGEPIVGKRWTDAQKERIRSSRIDTTRALVDAVGEAEHKPRFFINASAIGYYGPRGDETITEEAEAGNDFLATVCRAWENEAIKAERHGLRVVRLRTGIVLGRGGGALAKMAPAFKFFVGGPLGSGKQWMSWIHLEDEVGLILFLVDRADARGAVNATAPNPATMKEFCRTLGKVLGRPSWMPAPAFSVRLMLGEMADMLLTGQRVVPAKALELGYRFRYPALHDALAACLPL